MELESRPKTEADIGRHEALSPEIKILLDVAPATFAYIDTDMRYVYANARLCEAVRRRPDQIIGRHLSSVLGSTNFARIAAHMERALSGTTQRITYEEHMVETRTGPRWMVGHLIPDVVDGVTRGVAMIVRDIHRRKLVELELEQQRRRQNEQLEQQVLERTVQLLELQQRLVKTERLSAAEELGGTVATAVNEPLGSLLETIDAAQQGAIDMDSALARIHSLGKRINELVQGTLGVFRRGDIELREQSPAQLLEGVYADIRSHALLRGVRIMKKVPPDLPLILADVTLLGSALARIAENALQATPSGGRIWLEADSQSDGRIVRIRIEDEGDGIPEALRTKVLEPFFTTKRDRTGLGLAIATGVIQGHGGSLRIEDRPGGGTIVVVELLTSHIGVSRPE